MTAVLVMRQKIAQLRFFVVSGILPKRYFVTFLVTSSVVTDRIRKEKAALNRGIGPDPEDVVRAGAEATEHPASNRCCAKSVTYSR